MSVARRPFEVQLTPSHACVLLTGELDLSTVDALAAALGRATRDGADVRVDLQGVTFLDSTSLAELAAARARTVAAGGRFTLANPSPGTARVLELAGLDVWLEATSAAQPVDG